MTKWTDESIKTEIYSVISALNLDRMPTRSEMVSVVGNGLPCIISKSKVGFYGWADKLGLETKKSETSSGKKYEFIAERDIQKVYDVDLDIKQMAQNYPFDLLVDDVLKIDVKVGKRHNHFGCPSYTFGTGKKYASCDLYLCYGLGEDGQVETVYLIPSKAALATTLNITIGGNSKYNKYINKWELIGSMLEKYQEALEVLNE
jgi:hypothetical protein